VVLKEVPPNSTAVGIPARVVLKDGVKVEAAKVNGVDLDQINIPDPVLAQINSLQEEVERLKELVNEK
jgi:serine O-acetyltransferase